MKVESVISRIRRVVLANRSQRTIGHILRRSGELARSIGSLQRRPSFKDIPALLDYATDTGNGFFRSFQVRAEIELLLRRVRDLSPRVVLEIGTANGGTLFLFSRVAAPDAHLVSLDLPAGEFGGGYPAWKIPFFRLFALPRQRIALIRDDSHSDRALQHVRKVLAGTPVDFLFIDGDHTYEGVKRDFEMYSPLVRRGGLVAFHDVAVHPPELNCHVAEFWKEVKQRHESEEFVADPHQGWAGIGILPNFIPAASDKAS